MFVLPFASISAGQMIGFGFLAVCSAAAGYVAWALGDGRKYRCPRCRARTSRFTRRCRRCQREIIPVTGAASRKIGERRLLVAELTFFAVLAAGGLLLVPRSSAPLTLERSSAAAAVDPAPAPAQIATRPKPSGDHSWPLADEVRPAHAPPQYEGWVAASKQRALTAYPALAVPGSDFQAALITRYRQLCDEKNPRLEDPRWPEELTNEIALRLVGKSSRSGRP